MCFQLKRMENDKDSSSEAQIKSSKTRKRYYLDLEISVFVEIFEFYLVTQSL